MTLRLIEICVDPAHADTIVAAASQHRVQDCQVGPPGEDGRIVVRLVIGEKGRQELIDAIQGQLSSAQGWQILILPVEAAITPKAAGEQEEDSAILDSGDIAVREELYEDIKAGTRLHRSFLLLTMLSTVVAAVGLLTDSGEAIIGAMVIAPLLGPNLAFVFGAAIADRKLISLAARTNLAGVAVTLMLSVLIGYLWGEPFESTQLLRRAHVGFDSVALALASGAAAVLSLTTGVSAVLVGVMVAVALLPPAAAMGIFLGGGQVDYALGAGILLAVNVVCVNLAAQLVFMVRGLAPRTMLEKQKSRGIVRRNIFIWAILLLALAVVIYVRPETQISIGAPHFETDI